MTPPGSSPGAAPAGRRAIGAGWWAAIFLLHALPLATRPALVGGDEVHYALLAHSIAVDGDVDLRDDYEAVASGSPAAGRKRAGQVLDRHVRTVAGRELSTHPVGVPLLLAPLVAVQQALAPGAAPDGLLLGSTLLLTFAALVAGWRTLSERLGDERRALAWVCGAYFASPLWFYSRTFFTEPYTWSLAVLSIAALARGRIGLASLLLGLTLATKETAILLVVPILAGACFRLPARRAALLALGPLVAAGGYLAKNLALGFPPLTTSQPFQLGELGRGALGLVVDPAHGLLPFAPLLVLGAVLGGLGRRARAHLPSHEGGSGEALVTRLAWAAFAAYFLLHAAWIDWRGGSCYGPRLLVPALPALALLGARALPASRVAQSALAAAFVAGFTVAWSAALAPWDAFWGASALALVTSRPAAAALGTALAVAGVWRVRRWFASSG